MRFLIFISTFVLIMCMSLTSTAGFEGLNGTTSLDIFNKIKCSTGTTCSRSGGDKFQITSGFEGLNGASSLGTFAEVTCDDSVTCSLVNTDQFQISTVGGLQNQVVASATTITAAECGSTFISGAAVQMELPEASTVLGCRLTFVVNAALALTINPDDADQILLLTNAAGDAIEADAAGETVVLEAISASAWVVIGSEKGTWSDVN